MPHLLPRASSQRALLLGAFWFGVAALGCDRIGYRPHAPTTSASLVSQGKGVSARVERIHAPYWQSGTKYHIDVRIDNDGKDKLHVGPHCIDLALLPRDGETLGAFPLATFPVVDASILEGEKDLDPGESGTYRLELDGAPIENGGHYALRFDRALSVPAGTLEPLPIVRPGTPKLGYAAPSEPTFIFVGRLGGGAFRQGPITGGLGGLELYFGPQFGRFSVGAYAMLGVGSVGGELRYRLEPARWVSIVPFAGYGYYHIVGVLGLMAGHGPRAGLEVDFSLGDVNHFGSARSRGRIGFYAHAGPAFMRLLPETATAVQAGMSFGFY